jgi:hypothetical protein
VIDSHLTSSRHQTHARKVPQARPTRPTDADPDSFAPVAITRRSGCDESVHFGAVVGLSTNGEIAFAIGDATTSIYPRSSNKPMQATAMVAGLRLPPNSCARLRESRRNPAHLDAAADPRNRRLDDTRSPTRGPAADERSARASDAAGGPTHSR